ncbi:hypothetical protein CPB84DRAFT_1771963 [Gymnopilus junonius]|uniref:Uncharacterized protein n=1 Tax=Gymnopilus junonius TaxID=109634 RepID=A0A9P5NSK9_GYMJU|nr:hypothetical protein CPB84DRAFT_1771963 [Gymnopilus junonius]
MSHLPYRCYCVFGRQRCRPLMAPLFRIFPRDARSLTLFDDILEHLWSCRAIPDLSLRHGRFGHDWKVLECIGRGSLLERPSPLGPFCLILQWVSPRQTVAAPLRLGRCFPCRWLKHTLVLLLLIVACLQHMAMMLRVYRASIRGGFDGISDSICKTKLPW